MDFRKAPFLFVFFILLAACGQEGASNEQTKEPAEELSEEMAEAHPWIEEDDAEFVVEVYSYNLMISRYSQLAMEKAATPALQDFATRSFQFHTALGSEIEDLAAAKVIPLPANVGADVQEHLAELQQKEGKEFDEAYIEVLDSIQDKMIDKYEDAAESAYDMNLRNWASRTLPNIKAHELRVEELEEKVE